MAVTMAEQQDGYGPPTPVPIFQWEPEFSTLLALYRNYKPKSVLEVGTYHGGTLYHWLQNSRKGTRIVSVDSFVMGVDNRHLYDDWNTSGADLHTVVGDSSNPDTIAAVEELGPFEWLFIDGGHYYQEVKADWENYGPMVKRGGVVCFHDILTHPSWPSIEVGRLWEEIKQDHLTFEIVQNRKAAWGGIGVVVLP